MNKFVLVLSRLNDDQFEFGMFDSPLYTARELVDILEDRNDSVHDILDYLEEYADFEPVNCAAILIDSNGEVTIVDA